MSASTSRTDADVPGPRFPERSRPERLRHLIRRASAMEAGGWAGLGRLIFARPRVPRGAVAVSYHRPVRAILIVFIVLSAVEIPIIDLIVHPWPFVRIPLLVLGIWGLAFMLGLLASYITRPHAVGPEGIRIRQGSEIDIALSWDDVLSVARRTELRHKGPKYTPGRTDDAWVLHLPMQDETNLVVELERPVEITMPQGAVRVDEIRFWGDDPLAFLSATRPHLEAAGDPPAPR